MLPVSTKGAESTAAPVFTDQSTVFRSPVTHRTRPSWLVIQTWPLSGMETALLTAPNVKGAVVSSAPFVAKIRKAEFYQDPQNPDLKKGVFELHFSHPVNAAELEKRIDDSVSNAMSSVRFPKREELETLRERVVQLEKLIDELVAQKAARH